MTLPNYISMARGAFGPVLGAAYVVDAVVPEAMLAGVAVAGLSDWLDGYAARRMRLTSVAGTYLDPLGDKIFVASVAGALAAKGGIPLWLATAMVARDVRRAGAHAGLDSQRLVPYCSRRIPISHNYGKSSRRLNMVLILNTHDNCN